MDAIFDAVATMVEAVVQGVAVILAAIGLFLLMLVFAFATAIVARDYWNWFVSPLGLPPIGLMHALGLTMFIGFLRTDYTKKSPPDENDSGGITAAIVGPFVGLGLTWGLGWLIVTFAGPF